MTLDKNAFEANRTEHGRQLSVFADTIEQALEVLAYEIHLWEVRESLRVVHHSLARMEATAERP